MLGKLLKYEFKATSKTFIPVYAGFLLSSLMMALFTKMNVDSIALNILMVVFSLVYLLLTFAVTFIPIFGSLQRFNKNLLGEEGYLTNTLPASTNQLLLAKVFPAIVWMIISIAASIASQWIMLATAGETDMAMNMYSDIINQIFDFFKNDPFLGILIIVYILTLFIGILFTVYSSVCLGHLSNAKRGLKSFLWFLVLALVVALIFGIFMDILDGMVISEETTVFSILIGINVVFISAMYFLMHTILSKKLNLE
ncbi:MAG: hypothetical protein WC900_04850 [Oscillospiraceae bacterium]|jgi:hypothetical protein